MLKAIPYGPFTIRPADRGEKVFRLVDSQNPGVDQFLSDEADGRTDTLVRTLNVAIYRGFSTRRDLESARQLAGRTGHSFVAELALDAGEGDCIAHTFGSNHRTVWAVPESIVDRITAIHPAARH